jgi:hypothetical protein
MELTVACLWWDRWCGDTWGPEYVERLRNMVRGNLSLPHRFVCFTDKPEKIEERGIETLPMDVPKWKWNLRKTVVYKKDNGLSGRVIVLDLDMIILRSIDFLARYRGEFCIIEDFYHKGLPGGSIMSFEAGTLQERFYDPLVKNGFNIGWKVRGSERYWYKERRSHMDFWQDLYPDKIVSFKPTPNTRLNREPEEAAIVCFHGRPRPHEVDTSWVVKNWK